MAGVLRQEGVVEVQVVCAGALNQAIKAVAIASGYVASGGLDLVCVPTFADIEIDGERRTVLTLVIEDRERRRPDGEVIVIHNSINKLVAQDPPRHSTVRHRTNRARPTGEPRQQLPQPSR